MYKKSLASLSLLFFLFGFITCLNDILVPFLKESFKLDYSQAALVQFCFFGAFGIMSIPASKVIERVGYQTGIVVGLCVSAIGCLLFFPAVSYNKYGLFLFALFILATGIVQIQVAANPFVSSLGPKPSASSRLTMVQAFNSFGTFLAPFFGAYFILSKLEIKAGTHQIIYPYVLIAIALAAVAILFRSLEFPKVEATKDDGTSWGQVLKQPSVFFGMLGIFAYVGAEVSIGSFLVNYVVEITPMPKTQAANLVAIYWGVSMAGRFLGIFTLKEFAPGRVLSIHGLLAIALILISVNSQGLMSIYSMILVGFCNSIMFPTIFTLANKGLSTTDAQKGSGLMATAIIGGALIPVFTGMIADAQGLRVAFSLPIICYGYISIFGLRNIKELSNEKSLPIDCQQYPQP
ncbi:MAG TPA: sugar MFS transporter [Bacteriovoracaceae bacterium]|nr:sugar MFS transporter [Bacteriovoracaceae bacterium]